VHRYTQPITLKEFPHAGEFALVVFRRKVWDIVDYLDALGAELVAELDALLYGVVDEKQA
jgi:hypothetical protein